ncbi:hypothetical protein ACFT7S_37140 [Streptomyces sp. NPDC057136]|uniref:hypothetical protein n=1 Tax=Streptomyces sp. NPDC057136 TaxID=3346029 RepID=UPI003637BB3B
MSDPNATPLLPGRAEVAARWSALASGEVTREAVHAWAFPWVEGEGAFTDFEEPLVLTGLQYLHGFDLCRDPGRPHIVRHGTLGEGEWVASLDDIIGRFAHWQEQCALYDADPQGWSQAVLERARAFVRAEEAAAASARSAINSGSTSASGPPVEGDGR